MLERIKLFDFDGVLGSPLEEALFQLPESDKDVAFIEKATELLGLRGEYERKHSLRYMCMQGIMHRMGDNISQGPMFGEATGNYMILTARSDYYAIKRMFEFLDCYDLRPMRVFTLGNTPKAEVIRTLLGFYPEHRFDFWDDLQKHLDGANALGNDRVRTFKVDNDMQAMYEKALGYYQDQILGYFE
jgi:hypothetical protein